MEVKVPVVSQRTCNKTWGGEIYDSMICAGGRKGKDSCVVIFTETSLACSDDKVVQGKKVFLEARKRK